MKERTAEARWIENQSRWCCRVMVNGKRKAFYSTTAGRRGKREAERKADEWIERGALDCSVKFGDAWVRFLEDDKKHRGENNPTYKQHAHYGDLYILPWLEFYVLSEMVPADWKRPVLDGAKGSPKTGKPLSHKTLETVRSTLHAFRDWCEDNGVDHGKYPRSIDIPKEAPVGQKTILQADDIQRLFDPIPCKCDTHYLYAWQFAVITGIRPGELYGLKTEDVHGTTMYISRSVNNDGIITEGKNENARRVYELPRQAVLILEDQKAYLKSIGVISPYVFPDENGFVTRQGVAYKRWLRFSKAQQLVRTCPYGMRHTNVSHNKKVPLNLLKPVLGHSENMDTIRYYGHELEGEREEAAKAIGDNFANILGGRWS